MYTNKFSWAIATKPHQKKKKKTNPNMIILFSFPNFVLKTSRELYVHILAVSTQF